jgi:hypothetical protein
MASMLFTSVGLVATGVIIDKPKLVDIFLPITTSIMGTYTGSLLENHYKAKKAEEKVPIYLPNAPLTDTYIKELLKDKYLPDNILDGNVK